MSENCAKILNLNQDLLSQTDHTQYNVEWNVHGRNDSKVQIFNAIGLWSNQT